MVEKPTDATNEHPAAEDDQRTFAKLKQDATPNELFDRMVTNDAEQNKRLSITSLGGYATVRKFQQPSPNAKNKETKVRFVVCAMALIVLTLSQMSRMVLNIALPQMIYVSESSSSKDGSCPFPVEIDAGMSAVGDDDDAYSLTTMSDIYIWPQGSRANGTSSQPDDKFKWTVKQQQILKSSFYYSYFIFMIVSGSLAEKYGAKYVVLVSIAGSSLINLATPWMARENFVLLVISRVLMGIIQAGVFPALYALFNRWLTMSEASIFVPLIKTGLRLGSFLASSITGIVSNWPAAFYLTGVFSLIISLSWLFLATSRPEQNAWVNEVEMERILRKKRTQFDKLPVRKSIELADLNQTVTMPTEKTAAAPKPRQIPWLNIFTCPSVIGFTLCRLTFNYTLDFLAIEFPTYLKNVQHADKEQISFITSSIFLVQVCLIIFVGWLAKTIVLKRPYNMSKTTIRKSFQAMSSYVMGAVFFAMTFNDCNLGVVASLALVVSFLSMFTAGGETMLPYDISDEYPGTIMAVANSIANTSGVTVPALTGFILGEEAGSYDRWNRVIRIIAAANILGGLIFTIFVKAEKVDFHPQTNVTQQPTESSAQDIRDEVISEKKTIDIQIATASSSNDSA